MKSPYEELGVPHNVSAEDIKKAYRRLALQHHPDKVQDGADKNAAEERFKRISDAYAVLGDEERRRFYDQTGRTDQNHQHPPPPDMPDIHELMRNMFGGGGGNPFFGGGGSFQQQQHQHPPPGVDMVNIVVTPVEVFKGMKKTYGIEMNVDCSVCSGRGTKYASDVVACNSCQGSGMMSRHHGPIEFSMLCTACGGKGKAIASGKGCNACGSSGSTRHREEFTIELPPGFRDRHEIVVRRRGTKIKEARERNDVKFVVDVRWPQLEREQEQEQDLVKDIRMTDNATGAVNVRVEVGLLDLLKGVGRSIDLYGTGDPVPVLCFSDGYKDPTRPMVLHGMGLPRGKDMVRGDLTVTYVVAFPPDGSERANALKKFAHDAE